MREVILRFGSIFLHEERLPNSLFNQETCGRKVLREDHPAVIEHAFISGSSSREAGGIKQEGRWSVLRKLHVLQ